jgi:hypothetical protein
MDPWGAVISSLGLVGLTYGLIEAGQKGWSDASALASMLAGAAVLAVFVVWERRFSRPTLRDNATGAKARQPLVDLGLFRSAGFTWGTTLATLVSFALFGVLFAMPQYFQDVRGLDALASGVRLLPLIAGMIVGMLSGTYLQGAPKDRPLSPPRANAKALVAVGFTMMAAGLVIGTFTHQASGWSFVAAWFAIAGLGLGLAMPTATNAALGALKVERSGSGAAVISATRQVGATMGVAVLGTVLGTVYRSHLTFTGQPSAAAAAVRSSVAGGIEVAHEAGSASLLDIVRSAFTHGVDTMLWVSASIAIAGALIGLAFLPRRASSSGSAQPSGDSEQPSDQGAAGASAAGA